MEKEKNGDKTKGKIKKEEDAGFKDTYHTNEGTKNRRARKDVPPEYFHEIGYDMLGCIIESF